MGEQAVFSARAHVFTIDPKTKKSWIPASSQAVDVKFYFDHVKACYRIVSVEESGQGKKVVINSSITPKMNFKKTSQKFGQWTDTVVKVVYGLGFNAENELDQFVDQFIRSVESSKRSAEDDQTLEPVPQRHDLNRKNSNADAHNENSPLSPPSYSSTIGWHPGNNRPSQSDSASSDQHLRDTLATAQTTIVRLENEMSTQRRESEGKLRSLGTECKRLQGLVEERQQKDGLANQAQISRLESDNTRMRQRVAELEEMLRRSTADYQPLPGLNERMAMHLREVVDLHKKMSSVLTTSGGSGKSSESLK